MRVDSRFALLNLLPWGVYGLLNLLLASLAWQSNALALLLSVGLPLVLYGISGAIRWRARRHHWLSLPAGRLLARVMVAVLGGAALAQLLMHGLLRLAATWLDLPAGGSAPAYLLVYWANTAIVLGLWCAGWFGWQAIVQAQRSRLAQLQAEAQAAQLQHAALRARLNPHFLFNALNNLRALILLDPERARQQVDDLSLLLRHALDHGDRGTIPLREELAVVDAYLAMEAIHHEARLQIQRQIEPGVLDTPVPPMAVQLLLENAIKHGIAVTPGGGRVVLQAMPLESGGLRVAVSSPGRIGQGSSGHGIGTAYLAHALAPLGGRHGLQQTDDGVLAWLELPT